MQTTKYLGVWMDHASAHLMELGEGPGTATVIHAQSDANKKSATLEKSEKGMKRQIHEGLAYYKEIGKAILNYDEVLLFGPTDAKTELFNLLKADHHFDKVKMVVKSSDKMTEPQEYAFVRDHFKSHANN